MLESNKSIGKEKNNNQELRKGNKTERDTASRCRSPGGETSGRAGFGVSVGGPEPRPGLWVWRHLVGFHVDSWMLSWHPHRQTWDSAERFRLEDGVGIYRRHWMKSSRERTSLEKRFCSSLGYYRRGGTARTLRKGAVNLATNEENWMSCGESVSPEPALGYNVSIL